MFYSGTDPVLNRWQEQSVVREWAVDMPSQAFGVPFVVKVVVERPM